MKIIFKNKTISLGFSTFNIFEDLAGFYFHDNNIIKDFESVKLIISKLKGM
jgi:hypothetical protein